MTPLKKKNMLNEFNERKMKMENEIRKHEEAITKIKVEHNTWCRRTFGIAEGEVIDLRKLVTAIEKVIKQN